MANEDMLEMFKKHLKDIDGANFETRGIERSKMKNVKFGEDVKSANELIGALQVMDITLKKILMEAQSIDEDFEETTMQYNKVSYNIGQLVDKCSFMGMGLFDVVMSTEFGGSMISFDISSPMVFVLQKDFGSLKIYLQDKREEIKSKLSLISKRISGDNNEEEIVDSFNSFSAKDFTKMFKNI